MADFLRSLSSDHPVLWTLFVLGVIAGTAVALYGIWETVIKLAASAYSRVAKRKQAR